jgi:hypothetical protein
MTSSSVNAVPSSSMGGSGNDGPASVDGNNSTSPQDNNKPASLHEDNWPSCSNDKGMPHSLPFLSFPSRILHKAWGVSSVEGIKPSYSALGARGGIIGSAFGGKVGEVVFDEPDGINPSGVYENSFRETITIVTAGMPPQCGSGMSVCDFVEHIGETNMFNSLRPPASFNANTPAANEAGKLWVSAAKQGKPDRGTPLGYLYNPGGTAIHLVCPVELFDRPPKSPEAARDLVFNLLRDRHNEDEAPTRDLSSGMNVWKPEFHSTGDNTNILDKVKKVCRKVDVIVPTDTYLEKIIPTPKASAWRTLTKVFKKDENPARSAIERRAKEMLISGVGICRTGCVVVRTKDHGCLVATRIPESRKCEF